MALIAPITPVALANSTPPKKNWANSPLARYNNLDPTTYRYGSVLGKSDFHVDISKCPRGKEKIPPKFHLILPKFHFIPPKFYFAPTWKIKNIHVEI